MQPQMLQVGARGDGDVDDEVRQCLGVAQRDELLEQPHPAVVADLDCQPRVAGGRLAAGAEVQQQQGCCDLLPGCDTQERTVVGEGFREQGKSVVAVVAGHPQLAGQGLGVAVQRVSEPFDGNALGQLRGRQARRVAAIDRNDPAGAGNAQREGVERLGSRLAGFAQHEFTCPDLGPVEVLPVLVASVRQAGGHEPRQRGVAAGLPGGAAAQSAAGRRVGARDALEWR